MTSVNVKGLSFSNDPANRHWPVFLLNNTNNQETRNKQ
jgi:hypothetical protein